MRELALFGQYVLEGRPFGMALQLALMSRHILGTRLDVFEGLCMTCMLGLGDLAGTGYAQMTLALPDGGAVGIALARDPTDTAWSVTLTAARPSAQAVAWLAPYPATWLIGQEDQAMRPQRRREVLCSV